MKIKDNRKISKILILFFIVGFLVISFNYFEINKIFAETSASRTIQSAEQFNQGSLSDLEVSGSGEGGYVQLEGDGGSGWFDTDWQFRQPITINNSGSAQTNYQVKLEISYDSAMQADFDDLRFSNLSGSELDYWLQSKTNSDSAVVWVEVDSLAGNGDTIIYMYYSNNSVDSGSNGEGTFLFFDDFDNGIIDEDKWTEVDPTGYISETEGVLRFDSAGSSWSHGFYTDQSFERADLSFEFDYVWWQNNPGYDATMFGWKDDSSAISYTNFPYAYYNNGANAGTSITQMVYEDGSRRNFSDHNWDLSQDYAVRVRMKSAGGAHYDYSLNSGESWTNAYDSSYSNETALHPGWTHHSGHHDFDNARVRKWMSSEPTNSFGVEESALSPTGTYTSPTDSNTIDLIWNGDWGDGTDGSTAFEATVANVGANSSVTFQMRTAATTTGLSTATYQTMGIANSGTTFTKTKAEMDALNLDTGSEGRYVQIKATLSSSDGITNPQLNAYSIYYMRDSDGPEVNASSITMKTNSTGDNVVEGNWTKDNNPYFSWTAGSDSQSDIKGYCLYLGTDSEGNPESAKGLLGTSPVSTAGTDCQFITDQTSIDFSTESYQGSTWLQSSSDFYYLNIKAIDGSGNVFNGDSASFNFKFDNTKPTNPTGISASQTFLSDIEDFIVYWTTSGASAALDNHSGIKGYQYKIGSTGTWYGANHIVDGGCEDVITEGSYSLSSEHDSLEEGDNTFYLRTFDNVCNVSEFNVTAVLKYSGNSPSEPQGLTVDPDESEENSFAFEWNAPSSFSGLESGLSYCYSINTPPSSINCTWTDELSLEADAYANQPGENIFYVVARDEAYNVNYDAYDSVEFDCNTSSPGIPRSLDAADISIKATSNWKLAVSWEEPENVGAGVENYKVYRSTTADSCSTNFSGFELAGTTAGTSYTDTNLSQLNYYYCIKACDSANNCSAVSSTATNYPDGKFTEPAELLSGPTVSNTTTKRTTISWTTDRVSDSKVSYGKKSGSYYDEEPSNSIQTTSHEINLTSLDPGERYYYKVKWTDEDGNTGISQEKNFETDDAPSISSVEATDVGITSAFINFEIENASSAQIVYGESTSYGGLKVFSTSTSESSYSTKLSGLKDGTTYHYKIILEDSEEEEYEFEDHFFQTLPRPRISNVRIQQVKNAAQPTALISWETNTEVSSILTYYPEGNPGATREEVDSKLKKGTHQMVIKGLTPQTPYSLIVKGRDKIGNEAISDIQKFSTASDTRPPLISDLSVEGSSLQKSKEGQIATSQLIVSWTTDEAATSQVEFGEGTGEVYTQRSQEDNNLTFNHMVIISGLTPSKVYHLKAISKDEAGNESKSVDTVTITPKVTDNALDLVVGNLRDIFGFLK